MGALVASLYFSLTGNIVYANRYIQVAIFFVLSAIYMKMREARK